MQVAEKRIPEDKGMATVIVAKQKNERGSEQERVMGTYALTEIRGVYEASGSGTHPYATALSTEVSQATPFMSLSHEHWQEVRAQIASWMERFVLAVEEGRAGKVQSIGVEIQIVAERIFLEAYAMSADLGLKEIPR